MSTPKKDLEELLSVAREAQAERAEKWSGESQNDSIARAIIGSLRPLMESMAPRDGEIHVSPVIWSLATKQFLNTLACIQALDSIARLRDSLK